MKSCLRTRGLALLLMASPVIVPALPLGAQSGPAAAAQSGPAAPAQIEPAPPIHVAFLTGARPTEFEASALLGARMGAVEAQRTAEMMDGRYALRVIALRSDLSPSDRAALDSSQIVISALPESDLQRIRAIASDQLILDLAPVGTPVVCDSRVLHFAVRSATPGTIFWHSALERFGAQQLNERFARANSGTMDEAAWLGWFATKVALELSMRARAKDGDALAAFARTGGMRFDGHKGKALVFDARSGVLLQPVYEQAADNGAPTESPSQPALPHCRARAP